MLTQVSVIAVTLKMVTFVGAGPRRPDSAGQTVVGYFANFAVTLRSWRLQAFDREGRKGRAKIAKLCLAPMYFPVLTSAQLEAQSDPPPTQPLATHRIRYTNEACR
jgi:hypothetical protein